MRFRIRSIRWLADDMCLVDWINVEGVRSETTFRMNDDGRMGASTPNLPTSAAVNAAGYRSIHRLVGEFMRYANGSNTGDHDM